MNCRAKYSTEIIEDIYNIVGVGRTSAVVLKHNSLLLPIGGKDNDNKRLASKHNTYYWAQRIQNIVNTKYNSELFGNLVSIDNVSNNKGTVINLTIPTKLIDAYEVKHGDIEYSAFLKEHQSREQEGNYKVDDEGNIFYQLPKKITENTPLTEDIVFYPAQFTTIAYDKELNIWVKQIDDGANIGGEKGFKKEGYLYSYAPWMGEDAYTKRKTGTIESITISEKEYYDEKGDLDDDPFAPEQISFKEAKEYWEDYKKSQDFLRSIQPQTNSVGKKNQKLDNLLKEFANINGIRIDYFEILADKYGNDYVGIFDAVNKTIAINEGKEGIDTLPEEVAHSLVEGLGSDDFLVNKALHLIGKTDYKKDLDPEYIKLYKNNSEALKKEVLGKMIADVLVKRFEPTTPTELTLLDTILKLIRKFVSLFKYNDRIDQIEDIVEQLSDKIINKEKIVSTGSDLPSTEKYFSIDSKKNKNVAFREQYVYFKRRLAELNKHMDRYDESDEKYIELKVEYNKIQNSIEELKDTGNKQIIIDLGNELLDNLENRFIEKLESNKLVIDKVKPKDMIYAVETLAAFNDFPGLSDKSKILYNRLEPFIGTFTINEVNTFRSEENELTKADLESQDTDINVFTKGFGALADLGNYLGRTIGSLIKAAQNRISTENKKVTEEIKKEVDALREYSKSVGISEENMYEPFIQEYKGTTVLTKPYTTEFYDLLDKSFKEDNKAWRKANASRTESGEWIAKSNKFNNPNYTKIQNTKELKRFYEFHKTLTINAAENLPKKINGNFIANIKKDTLMNTLKSDLKFTSKLKEGIQAITRVDSKEFNEGSFVNEEDLFQDVIPLKYIAKIDAKDKSTDLGANLLAFVSFANSYKELSEVLPRTRLLQEEIKKKKFKKSSDPSVSIEGEESNIFKMVDDYIRMQVKGQMKQDEFKIKTGTLYDEEGNSIGEKYIHGSDIIDFGLRYNSLLRIGLNPFNAVTNILVGDIGNIIEGFGSRFYSLKDLKNATNIFFSQNLKEDSELNKWLDKLNPLQELEDYENIDKVSLSKKLNADKVKNIMYTPQKWGEKFLQTRTMLAILIKDGYMTSDGVATEKGNNLTEEQLTKLSDKIQRVNQMIHGRYSSRDAATIQQSALWRAAFQFKKWIPAAIESRVQSKHYDNRLGVEIEGRYITAYKLLVKDLKGTLERLQNGQITELEKYNMRKNLSEITIIMGTIGLFQILGWDDDKKRKQSPHFKYWMNQLDRVSGDLLFFYNPSEVNRTLNSPIALSKTVGDLLEVVANVPYAFGLENTLWLDKSAIYKKGQRKGENKFVFSFTDVIPIVKPLMDFNRLNNKEPYQEPNHRN